MNGRIDCLRLANTQNISILAFVMVLYSVRNAVPYIFFPLMILITIYVGYTLLCESKKIATITNVLKIMHPFFIFVAIEIISFITAINYNHIDIIRYVKDFYFYICYFFLICTIIRTKEDVSVLIKYMTKFFFWFGCGISIISAFKYFYAPDVLTIVGSPKRTIYGTSLMTDYNFFSLFFINAIILNLYKIYNDNDQKHWKGIVMAIAFMFWIVIMSSSRRGTAVAIILYAACLILTIVPPLYKKLFNKHTYKRNLLFVIMTTIFMVLSYTHVVFYQQSDNRISKILKFDVTYIERSNTVIGYRLNSIIGHDFIKIKNNPSKPLYTGINIVQNNQNVIKTVEEGSNKLVESRKDCWERSKETYSNYSITQKILGTGFRYLQYFYYPDDLLSTSHPHFQPYAILLMSGIVGLLLWLFLIAYISYIYLKRIKAFWMLALLFSINFIFGIFSNSNFLGMSMLLFLIIIPFIYNHIDKEDNKIENADKDSRYTF